MADIDITPSSSLVVSITQSNKPSLASGSPSVLPKPVGWWKELTAIYQVYPASFLSSVSTSPEDTVDEGKPQHSGDGNFLSSELPSPPTTGLGDIRGITSKLEYLASLGIEAIWLSPVYTSPLVDMGYDISDYTTIDPRFGTLRDIAHLIRTAHDLGIRVLMDLVVNHTSDRHVWFQESKKSRHGEMADFYIWKDPVVKKDMDAEGKMREVYGPPNNWASFFGGSAWTYVPERGQYYLHLFDYRQPDLNWELEHVRQRIYDEAIRFWLDRGVDGFRVDTCGLYSKDQRYLDGKVDKESRWGEYGDPAPFVVNGPRIHEFWKDIRKEALSAYGDVLMIGELGTVGKEEILKYVDAKRKELSCVFGFEMASLGGLGVLEGYEKVKPGRAWTIKEMKDAIAANQEVQTAKGKDGWATVFLENHDLPRSLSRFGDVHEKYRERSAKLLAILLGSLSGTLVLYQGQEIGMSNIPENWSVDDLRDIASVEYYERKKKENPGDEDLLKRVWRGICAVSRDNARTPVQWSDGKYGGFGKEPWMRVNDNHKNVNVKEQEGKDDSVLEFWRKTLKLRRENKEVLVRGSYKLKDVVDGELLVFAKSSEDGKERLIVALNFSETEVSFELPDGKNKWKKVLSNVDGGGEKLRAWEGRIYREI